MDDRESALGLVERWKKRHGNLELLLLAAVKKESEAYAELCSAEKQMEQEHDRLKALDENYRMVWEEFEDFKFCVDAHITLLNLEIMTENEELFSGYRDFPTNRSELSITSKENKINLLISRKLLEELEKSLREAEAEAEAKAPRKGDRYLEAKECFLKARANYNKLHKELEDCERERERISVRYSSAREAYEAIEEALAVAELRVATTE